eukprot:SAG31_NODE_5727_length_2358_cov_1.263834_1_plen_110_part_10
MHDGSPARVDRHDVYGRPSGPRSTAVPVGTAGYSTKLKFSTARIDRSRLHTAPGSERCQRIGYCINTACSGMPIACAQRAAYLPAWVQPGGMFKMCPCYPPAACAALMPS